MPPGGGNLQGPFRLFLAFDVAQIAGVAVREDFAGARRGKRHLARKMPDRLDQARGTMTSASPAQAASAADAFGHKR